MLRKKVLITGGAGFIGSHIVDAYINEGHELIIIDNLSTGKRENINPKAKFYELDVCSDEAQAVIEKERPDILNHHAAQIDVRVSVSDPLNDIKVNVMGLVGLLEAGRKSGLKKVIFASSGGTVYGDQKEFPATEDHPTWPVSPYGLNKLMCEKYLYYYKVVKHQLSFTDSSVILPARRSLGVGGSNQPERRIQGKHTANFRQGS